MVGIGTGIEEKEGDKFIQSSNLWTEKAREKKKESMLHVESS